MRIGEICSTAGFLESTRSAPAEARSKLEEFIGARLVAHPGQPLDGILSRSVTIAVTLLHPYWVGYFELDT